MLCIVSYIILMFGGILHTCLCVHRVHAWCPRKPEEGLGSPGTEVTGGCGLPYVDGKKQCVNMSAGRFGKADNALNH